MVANGGFYGSVSVSVAPARAWMRAWAHVCLTVGLALPVSCTFALKSPSAPARRPDEPGSAQTAPLGAALR